MRWIRFTILCFLLVVCSKGNAKDITAGPSSASPDKHSQFRQAIQDEFRTLSETAQKIIKKNNPKLKQLHVVYSDGGYPFKEALKLLTPEYRQTMLVINVSSTVIIENDLACEVYNIFGDKEWPSLVDFGIDSAKRNWVRIEYIPQTKTQLLLEGNSFIQPEYQFRISSIINNELAKKYEIN